MDIPWFQLAALFALTIINGFFAGSEIAFVSLRESQLAKMSESNQRQQRAAILAQKPSSFFAACQIGITLAGVLASMTAAVSLSEPLAEALRPTFGKYATGASFVIVTGAITFITLVFGELVPKRIAMQTGQRWAVIAVDLLRLITTATRPIVWLLEKSSDLIVGLLGLDPSAKRNELTEDEIRALLVGREEFSPEQRSIIDGAFEIQERTLREVLIPRSQVIGLNQLLTGPEALAVLTEAGFSRAPVHTGDLDDVLGIVHVRDLVGFNGIVGNRARAALVLPESLNVLDGMRHLRAEREQLALVVDEHGGVEGIVTVEDLLEEVVGEIYDEFDKVHDGACQIDENTLEVAGTYPIHDLTDLGVEIPDGEGTYSTIAGFVLFKLGHIPTIDETVESKYWTIRVIGMKNHAIDKLRLYRKTIADDDRDDAGEPEQSN